MVRNASTGNIYNPMVINTPTNSSETVPILLKTEEGQLLVKSTEQRASDFILGGIVY